MVVKVRGDDIRSGIVGRMLHRGEGIDLLSQRKYDNSARMLSRGPSDAHASLYDPVDLAGTLPDLPFFIVMFHIPVGGLVRQGSDGTRPEGLAGSENYFCIFVALL